jgi:hypothetical protein
MAAQPNFWGTIVVREGATSGRIPPRRETKIPGETRYYQPLPSKRVASADFPADALVDSRNSSAVGVLSGAPGEEAEQSGGSDPLAIIQTGIDKLMSPEENSGDPEATAYAYRNARAIVESVYGRLYIGEEPGDKRLRQSARERLPLITTDELGGVRLSWQNGDRHVRINFAAAEDLRSYLYFESPAEHDVQALRPSTLLDRLKWMLNA